MRKNSNLVTIVDLGETKVVCLIAKTSPTGEINIIGVGHQSSEGFKAGTITDMKSLRSSIIAAIYAAEQMASVNIDTVIVNVSSPLAKSTVLSCQINLGGRQVIASDIKRLTNLSLDKIDHTKDEILYYSPLRYDVDDFKNVQNPEFMFANNIKIDTCVTTIPNNILVNIASCFAGCHIKVGEFVLTSYSSAIACLSKDEMTRGAVLIDIGGGSTNFCIFENEHQIFTGTIPLGGKNITKDIATFFSISINEAERIKVIHGSAITLQADQDNNIPVKQFSEDNEQEPNSIKNALLNQVIGARVEEILQMVKEKLKQRGFVNLGKKTIVLTGGGAQLSSLTEVAENIFGSKCRIGIPKLSTLDSKITNDPGFATAVGMIKQYYMSEYQKQKFNNKNSSFFGKIIHWLQQNF